MERCVEQHKRAGAVRLPRILAQGLQHGLLQLLHGLRVPVKGRKGDRLRLDDGGHILRQMHAHDGDIPPKRGHIREEGIHLEGQGSFRFGARTFEPPQQKKGGKQHHQQQGCQRAHVKKQPPAHGGLGILQF